ncbi:MAG: alpha/beta hydrolase, partial [Oceanobacter sp.]
YLHGNAENISSHIASVAWLPMSGVGMLALDYRGFGASTGRALVPDVFQDIEAAAIWIRQQFPESRFVVLGQSIGASLSVPFVAKAQYQYQIDGLVLEAPFAGFGSVARDMLTQNWIGTLVWPFTWLVPDEWDPQNWAGLIQVPVLQIHSRDDQVVSIEQGRRLFERFENSALQAESISEPGLSQIESPQWIEARGPHIAAFADPSIRAQVLSFVKRID